ncbi:unnamed protein product [Polarella glacialis]|uniref:Uncharacterized protein n=1 Tax=Polarella glacialis TaxID=89957 RepID=A0A813ECY7_POLGL|nr:unnamed protein product [Polarella glacialis]
MLLIIERWAPLHGACDVGVDKTVFFLIGSSALPRPLLFRPTVCNPPAPLSFCTTAHRWLGWLWSPAGGACETLVLRVPTASRHAASLSGFVQASGIPLPLAGALFQGKVIGSLIPGMWLYAVMAPDAMKVLEDAWSSWGRLLLGAPPWKNTHAAAWELGWSCYGAAYAMLVIALRRARIWLWPRDDFYRGVFIQSHSFHESWASRSKQLLLDWGLTDICDGNLHDGLQAYKK